MYGNLVPLIVSRVPPPVPPRNGNTDTTVGVNDGLYVNMVDFITLFEFTVTLQIVSIDATNGGV